MSQVHLLACAVAVMCLPSCAHPHRNNACPAAEVLSIADVRTVVENFEWHKATVTLRLEGHGGPGTQACLGYPWTIRGAEQAAREVHMVIGSHGPCVTEALDASQGASRDVSVDVMTKGLAAGMHRVQFPIFVLANRSAQYCGDAESPEFFLLIKPGVHSKP